MQADYDNNQLSRSGRAAGKPGSSERGADGAKPGSSLSERSEAKQSAGCDSHTGSGRVPPVMPEGFARRAATERRLSGEYKRPKRRRAAVRLSRAEGRGRKGKRCYGHDYRLPGVYMITISASLGTMPLSTLRQREDGTVTTAFTKYGARVAAELRKLTLTRLDGDLLFRAVPYVIMPDHLHIMLRVLKPLPLHLESYIYSFIDNCNRAYTNMRAYDRRKLQADSNSDSEPGEAKPQLFADGFHDLIGFTTKMERNMTAYVLNNPLRLWQRRQYPDMHKVCVMTDGSFRLFTQGNRDLLSYPERYALRVSRRLTGKELEEYLEPYYARAARGAVIISPFISPGEKRALDEFLSMGGRVIKVETRRLIDGDKPGIALAEALAEGRMLRVWWQSRRGVTAADSKAYFEELNRGAAWLAEENRNWEIKN